MPRAYDRRVWRDQVRPAILARDGYACRVQGTDGHPCGRLAGEVGHRLALVDGGAPYDPRNLEAQCRAHNAADGARIATRRRIMGTGSRRW